MTQTREPSSAAGRGGAVLSLSLDGDGRRGWRPALRSCLVTVATPELAEDVMLVAGELVANALEHGRPPVVLHAVSERPNEVVVEVVDGGPPVELVPAPSAVGAFRGRGLTIVQSLSAEWGVRAAGRGKSVWARVGAPPDEKSTTTNER